MSKKSIRAIDAVQEAEKIAFAPFVFQAVVALRKLGIFDLIFQHRKKGGISLEGISKELEISTYGVGVLLEIAESYNIVDKDKNKCFELTTTGYFLAFDRTVDVNINFTQEVCYKGLFHLTEAIETGKPAGLKELGDWETIYQGLSVLQPKVQKAWFEFDHHYSDEVFQEALEFVFRNNPKSIYDVGANTGKFTIAGNKYSDSVSIKMVDLPGQLQIALKNIELAGFKDRVTHHKIDWLSENPQLPVGADAIWMSQFLDCFSEEEILVILKACAAAVNDNGEVLIMETFTDRQRFDNAKFILEATSLYFTVMANGNSKMYPSTVLIKLIDQAGLELIEDRAIGEYHTIFACKKK
ncbi:SAM-dependent methyltransferase [Bizionia argentinensis JUB59]|uniref:SAM-dependent methyltransferase n=1 Tax=Bizionia argentinensis JUB59 TaxID=1046627 RepID=G2EFA2_9FLAO|nr:methyltransferase [Bizionia argentinensis]EGV42917.1 SAM-dependent methyltransferase [Bizionia argentinensis JUB59]